MARPIPLAPSRGVLVAIAALVAVAVVAAALWFGKDSGPSASPSPGSPSPTATTRTSGGASPSAISSSTSVPSEPPLGLARWTAISPATPGPDARSGHTWTVDPSSAIAYLFGGRGSAGPFGDVWSYDLTADRWAEVRSSGEQPGPRFDHGSAWIDGLGLVIFGGRTDTDRFDDLWAFDPSANTWRAIDVADPRPSTRAAACLTVRADGRLWLYGGEDVAGTASSELWIYAPGPSTWTQLEVTAGPAVRSGAACWWTSDDRFVIHGGLTPGPQSAPLGDLWAFDPDGAGGVWQKAGDYVPRGRATWTATGRGGVVAGGIGADETLLADVIMFEDRLLAGTVLEPAPDGPAARSGAALADDPEGERTLMFGGRSADGPLADIWALDLP